MTTADSAPLRAAYIVSRYPYVSHTFILREIQALRDRGAEIDPVTVRRPEAEDVISPTDRAEQARTHAVLPTTARRLLRAHAAALARHPLAYLRTLADTLSARRFEPRATLWQLFYFAEGILVWRWLEDRRLRHIHAHHANVAADLAMVATRFGRLADPAAARTWSMTVHGPTEFTDAGGHKLALKTTRADGIIATSEYVRDKLTALAPQSAPRIKVIHCGIEPAEFEAGPAPAADAEEVRLLTVARLSRRKGVHDLLRALAQIHGSHPQIRLTVVGDGPERPGLERLAAELGLGGTVRFVGAVGGDEVARFYRDADVFCLASYAEGVPTVLMEAMATELPVVSTFVAGTPELVRDGEAGLLVSPGDVPALAAALARLADDPGLRSRMGQAGRRAVIEGYSLDASAAAVDRFLRWCSQTP